MKTYEGHQERVKEMSFTHKIAEHLVIMDLYSEQDFSM